MSKKRKAVVSATFEEQELRRYHNHQDTSSASSRFEKEAFDKECLASFNLHSASSSSMKSAFDKECLASFNLHSASSSSMKSAFDRECLASFNLHSASSSSACDRNASLACTQNSKGDSFVDCCNDVISRGCMTAEEQQKFYELFRAMEKNGGGKQSEGLTFQGSNGTKQILLRVSAAPKKSSGKVRYIFVFYLFTLVCTHVQTYCKFGDNSS